MNKKRIWLLCICVVLTLSMLPLAACRDTGTGETYTYTVGTTAGFAANDNPFTSNIGAAQASHMFVIYEPLIYTMSNGEYLPALAESWAYNETTKTWTVNLNSKAKWSDGNAVTANDVKFTFETLANVNIGGRASVLLAALDTIAVVDTRTVAFQFNAHFASFENDVNSVAIVPQHIWGEMTYDEIADYNNPNPIGSGPFVMLEGEEGSHYLYEARRDYWRGAPHIHKYMIRYFGTHDAQLLAFKRGEIDSVASWGIASAIPSLLADPNTAVTSTINNMTYVFHVNHRHEPWNLTAFRNAVSIGIDRARVIEFAEDGWGSLPNSVDFPTYMAFSTPELAWPYGDLTRAERIAQANAALDTIPNMTTIAGGTNGIRRYNGNLLQFELLSPSGLKYISIAQMVQEDCAEMGIGITVKGQTAGQVLNATSRQKSEATAMGWQTFLFHRQYFEINSWADHFGPIPDPPDLTKRNWVIGWQNEIIQNKIAQITEMMPGPIRDALIAEATLLTAAEMPVIPLYDGIAAHVYRVDRFTGWRTIGGICGGNLAPSQHPLQLLELRPI